MGKKKTQEEFLQEMEVKHPELEVMGEYTGNHNKVLIKCKICGTEFSSLPCNMVSKKLSGCPYCATIKLHNKQRKTHEQFISEMKEINPNLVVISEYKGAHKKIQLRCNVCNHEFSSKPNDLLYGKGCPKCGGTMRKTHEEFVSLVKKINPNINIISKYTKVSADVKVVCKSCGNIFTTRVHNLLYSQTGCPRCKMSHGEIKVSQFLDMHNIIYETQYRFKDCKNIMSLPFDFYIPSQNSVIEFDGIQHYKAVSYFGGENAFEKLKINDEIKTKYCNEHNIHLIRIPFFNLNVIDEILEDELLG